MRLKELLEEIEKRNWELRHLEISLGRNDGLKLRKVRENDIVEVSESKLPNIIDQLNDKEVSLKFPYKGVKIVAEKKIEKYPNLNAYQIAIFYIMGNSVYHDVPLPSEMKEILERKYSVKEVDTREINNLFYGIE